MKNEKHVILTVDVEEWFQVENFKEWIPFSTWPAHTLRVEGNIRRILDLLDLASTNLPGEPRKIKATFFFLGWLAERLPGLVREVLSRGHEVASHGYRHNLCRNESPEDFKEDIISSKRLLEDITGESVKGYRAPSFSIDSGILEMIREAGYEYDSSYNSFAMHGRYGLVDFSGYPRKGVAIRMSRDFYELPVSNLKIRKSIIPLGGGGYFRLFPSLLFRKGAKAILEREGAYVFYMHPWEVDPGQPRMKMASRLNRFRHYVNLERTAKKLESMIDALGRHSFVTCGEYISLAKKGL